MPNRPSGQRSGGRQRSPLSPAGADIQTCQVGCCGNDVFARGWCSGHYFRWLRTGDVRADEPLSRRKQSPICRAEDCTTTPYALGWCEKHYKRWRRRGEVADPREMPDECVIEDCPNPATERGWCHGHYLRWYRTGDVQAHVPLERRRQPETCTVQDCPRDTVGHGLCRTHADRLKRHGDVLADVPIREATGEGCLSHGYWKVPVPAELRHLTNGETPILEHRLVMARHLGRPLEPDEVVHHINGIRTDNRLENLELWSTSHPKGQRVKDKVDWALAIMRRYRPELLSPKGRARRRRRKSAFGTR
ncbi:MAG: HNH endonuclease signature motif containing protein [Nitriliruptorales bacterium]